MFAGIVQAKACVVQGGLETAAPTVVPRRLVLHLNRLADGLALGASVAVNGVCLTVCEIAGARLGFDVVPETLRRTNLGKLQPGTYVNIERSLCLGQPIDGHLVQGHVEGMAEVARIEDTNGEYKLWFLPPTNLLTYVLPKGAVALDGVSLTVADVCAPYASVALIPTTLNATTLGEKREGDLLNLETDFLIRAVVQRLEQMLPGIEKRAGQVAEARA